MIGIGEAKVPESLRNVCNRFVLIENIVGSSEEDVRPVAGTPVDTGKHPPTKSVSLMIQAMKALETEEDWVTLGALGSQINRANPDFDTRANGSSKLSDLLRKTGAFEIRQHDSRMQVSRKGAS